MSTITVLGGGPAGLATALFAARRGHPVTLLERDGPPPHGPAENDFVAWDRRGVAHARQGHVFLARSTQVLRHQAPDVLAEILDRGCTEVSLVGGGSDGNVLSRRLVYEASLRRAVEREPGVRVRSGAVATGLRTRAGPAGVPAVVAVRTASGAEVPADLVVDATGRTSRTPDWLAAAGARRPAEILQECGFHYLTRHYRLRDGASFPTTQVPIVVPLDYLTVLAFPGDNRRFQLSVAVSSEDPLRHQLREPDNFTRFLAAVPLSQPWIACGEPLDAPRAMARIENRWRRLVDGDGPVVTGYALIGDAALETNPTTGRGISLAFVHAERLAATAGQAAADPVDFAVGFDAWTAEHLGGWFESQLAIDEARLAQLRAGLRGERLPPPTDQTNRLVAAMATLRASDPVLAGAVMRAYNLLVTPRELMADRRVSRPVIAYLRGHPTIELRPTDGPDRAAFERLVGSHSRLSR